MQLELVILIMCVALALVCLAALIVGCVHLKNTRAELTAEAEREKYPPARVIVVKQNAGDVRVAYLSEQRAEVSVVKEEVAVAVAPAAVEEAVEELPTSAVQPEEPEEAPAEQPEGVLIPVAEKLTFEERYARLPEEKRQLLDEFTAYINGLENCETLHQASALAFRYKKGQIAKAAIRRDNVVLTFPIANPELGRMLKEEKVKGVRMQPAEIRLDEEADLTLAKQTADISVSYLQQEETYKIEKRKEARREAARKKREEEGGDAQ